MKPLLEMTPQESIISELITPVPPYGERQRAAAGDNSRSSSFGWQSHGGMRRASVSGV